MSKKTFEPTPAQAREALPGIRYEMDQMMISWRRACRAQKQRDKEEENAFLESALVHVRAIDAFLMKPASEREQKDVLADDFGFPCRKALKKEIRQRINKDLAHLTYDSVNRPRTEKRWRRQDFEPIITASIEFCDHVATKYLPSVNAYEPEVQEWRDLKKRLAMLKGSCAS
jgi:hypothetical protein